ncbi:hypothetical protein H9L15_14915 [Sphingomonas daechungensis]|uniref:UrcA family protein n=1 Tax=Sphingomonas daechungensis TaxID=1176646 RepID=A0ABX6T062_9SPHN|nr:hypothetical protein [Sphingomonas daechungensis]QNP43196.1 hypothetical protein H9L15_14915 [Sphingomonas daechungensis]
MSYFSYGAIAAVGFVAVVGGFAVADRGMNYKPAKANIFLIDRECRYDRVWTDGKRETVTDSCSSTDEFKELAAQSPAQRKKAVDGTAVVKVSYTALRTAATRPPS